MAKKQQAIRKKQKEASKASPKDLSSSKQTNPKKIAPKKTGKEPVSMEELLSQTGYRIPSLTRGQTVQGTIVSVRPKEILIDVGAKSEGIVAGREFEAIKDLVSQLSVGDHLTAQVVIPENDLGQVVLSLRVTGAERRWQSLENTKDQGEKVAVLGMEVNRGGLIVDYGGLRGFLPSSQLDSSLIGKISQLVGQKIEVYVAEVDQEGNRIIFSQRRKLTRDDLKKIASKIKIGQQMEGKVSAVLPFGGFVDLGGLEGMVHISEIAWEKVADPSSYFRVGETIQVLVLGVDESTGRINLSVKQLLSDPWKKLGEKYSKEQTIAGKVTRITPYGAFVNLEPGIDGLVHISKIPPDKSVNVGDVLDCTIESIDEKGRRISLDLVLKEKPIGYR